MAHAQEPDFVFWRNGRIHLNRRGRQFSRLPAAEVCASAVVMLDTPCSEVVWRILATHSIREFPLHFPSRASPCAITFQLDSTTKAIWEPKNWFRVSIQPCPREWCPGEGLPICPRRTKIRNCGYWLPTPFASFPFTSPPVRHHVPSHFNWSLRLRQTETETDWDWDRLRLSLSTVDGLSLSTFYLKNSIH
jgi:hypothetical protein